MIDPGLRLASVRTGQMNGRVRWRVVELCVEAHREPDFENLFSYLPDDGLHVLGWVDEALVGHAVATTRWLQVGSGPLLMTAYVDAVAVSPGRQRRGIGAAVMNHLAALLTPWEVACLETEHPGFYESLGWEEWRGPLGGRSADGIIPTPDQTGIMILRLPRTPALDFDERLTVEADGRIW